VRLMPFFCVELSVDPLLDFFLNEHLDEEFAYEQLICMLFLLNSHSLRTSTSL
jgi:hypothetical protein